MNNKEISRVLERLINPNLCNFLGVFSGDLIPNMTFVNRYPAAYVVNSDTSESPGEHWLAFYYYDKDICEFFDSYGLSPFAFGFNIHPSVSNTRFYNPDILQFVDNIVFSICIIDHSIIHYTQLLTHSLRILKVMTSL